MSRLLTGVPAWRPGECRADPANLSQQQHHHHHHKLAGGADDAAALADGPARPVPSQKLAPHNQHGGGGWVVDLSNGRSGASISDDAFRKMLTEQVGTGLPPYFVQAPRAVRLDRLII
eukprot:SAG22_NODE_301_length_12744_cov_19.648189_11_plen_118_part_00